MSYYNILNENTININTFLDNLNKRVNVIYNKDRYRNCLIAPVINNNKSLSCPIAPRIPPTPATITLNVSSVS
jgi:hypothetical protein